MVLAERGFKVAVESEDKHALTDLSIDIGEERDRFHACHLAHLIEKPISSLRDEVLAEPFNHLHAVHRFRELPLRRRQHAFQTDHDHVPDDEGPDVVRASSHELLLELDDGVPYRALDFALAPFLVIDHGFGCSYPLAARRPNAAECQYRDSLQAWREKSYVPPGFPLRLTTA